MHPLETSSNSRNAIIMYNNHQYPASSSPFSLMIIDKLLRKKPEGYILDYITQEFEAVISCPSPIPPAASSASSPTSATTPYSATSTSTACQTPSTASSPYSSASSSPDTPDTPHNHQLPLLPSPPSSRYISNHYNLKYNRQHYQQRQASGIPSPPYAHSHTDKPSISISKRSYIPLRYFVEHVIRRSRLDNGTLLASLCYARRLRAKLYTTSKGMECTHHRIFLATIMIAAKYIHDTAIKNKYWKGYALDLFTCHEINLMEKQLLQLLDYNLEIRLKEFEGIMQDVTRLYLKVHQYSNHYHQHFYNHQQQLQQPNHSSVKTKSPYVTPIITQFSSHMNNHSHQHHHYSSQHAYQHHHQNTVQPNHHQHRRQPHPLYQ